MSATDEPFAECMLDFGRLLSSRGESDRAKEVLHAALEIFTRRSTTPLREAALGAALRELLIRQR